VARARDDTVEGERVRLRPFEPGDWEALRAIRDEPDVELWWGAQSAEWPGDEDDVELLVVEHEGAVAGLVQFWEEPDEEYRHADVDILLTTTLHGRGLGTDAMRAIARHLIEDRGHHRITLTTSPDNARAIHVYEKVGFRRVGVTRLSERAPDGSWHDELLMELVVEPQPSATAR
jgi:aminoglycoside 6'-N-acetyltransferase